MRIMLDTNVLISALLFPGTRMDTMMNNIFMKHQLVLSSYVVEELKRVVQRKFPGKETAVGKMLLKMSYEYVYTPEEFDTELFHIRDMKDYPVLYTAMIEDIDILITGDKDFSDIEKRLLQSGEDYIAMLEEAIAGYGRYLDLLQARAEPDLIIQAFNEYQLLCALREGPFGVAGLNERIEQFMQQKRKIHRHPHSRWYEGRPVMIARNDSALGLFNGDIGIALDRGQGTRVWFAMPDGNIKSVQPSRLPEHETTWAMTVHKSQGSEFDHAALILPSQRTPVVTRELVYTAVTRARRRLSLYADERILSAAIATRTERRSGLAALFSSRE